MFIRPNMASRDPAGSLPLYNTSGGGSSSKQDSPRHPLSKLGPPAPPQQQASQLAHQLAGGLWAVVTPLLPVGVLCIGIYVTSLEAGDGRPVDREKCSCSCWDGRFKGRHGLSTHGVQYKSVYFNLEPATGLLAAWAAVWLHLLALCLQRLASLALARRLAAGATAAALLQFYPLFYGAWAVFNYVNDRFYTMLPSQLFFQLTELVPCFFIYSLLDSRSQQQHAQQHTQQQQQQQLAQASKASAHQQQPQHHQQQQPLPPPQPLPPLAFALGLAVNVAHILLALKERVLWGLFLTGIHTVNARDVMLVAGDVACIVLFARLLARSRLSRREAAGLLPWGLGCCVGLLLVYVAGLGYVYQ